MDNRFNRKTNAAFSCIVWVLFLQAGIQTDLRTVCANPIVPGEVPGLTYVSPRIDEVTIVVQPVEKDGYKALTTCRTVLDVHYVDPGENPDPALPKPTEILIQFPLPAGSRSISVRINQQEAVPFEGPMPIPEKWRFLFDRYEMIIFRLPPVLEEPHVDMTVSYEHLLPKENYGWRLQYASGTSTVQEWQYETASLKMILPMSLGEGEYSFLKGGQYYAAEVVENQTVFSLRDGFESHFFLQNVDLWFKPGYMGTRPVPTWNPAAPTPTPFPKQPNVLWLTAFPDLPTNDGQRPLNLEDFQGIFSDLGARNSSFQSPSLKIANPLLRPYSAVVFADARSSEPRPAEEQDCIMDYVRKGGSILVLGHQKGEHALDPSALYATSITKPFGIAFSTSIVGHYRDFVSHPVASGVSLTFGIYGSRLVVTPPAQAIGRAGDGTPILAVATEGYGRVAAYTDDHAFCRYDISFERDLNMYSHRRLAENLAAWLLHQDSKIPPLPPTPTPTPTLSPVEGIPDVHAWIRQILDANRPWLRPKPIQAVYSLRRYLDHLGRTDVLGPFVVQDESLPHVRIGSHLCCALHSLLDSSTPYTAKISGKTVCQGIPVTVLDIFFDSNVQESFGVGTHESPHYSIRLSGDRVSRIYIDSQRNVPLSIAVSAHPPHEPQTVYDAVWLFSPYFHELEGGYAPREIWSRYDLDIHEKLTFQVVDGVWIFQSSEAWYGDLNINEYKGKAQRVELIDLTISDVSSLPNWPQFR